MSRPIIPKGKTGKPAPPRKDWVIRSSETEEVHIYRDHTKMRWEAHCIRYFYGQMDRETGFYDAYEEEEWYHNTNVLALKQDLAANYWPH